MNEFRKDLLKKTLLTAGEAGWMSVNTLAHIIGADRDATRALLIEIGARGLMKTDKEVWPLISRNPLPTASNAE